MAPRQRRGRNKRAIGGSATRGERQVSCLVTRPARCELVGGDDGTRDFTNVHTSRSIELSAAAATTSSSARLINCRNMQMGAVVGRGGGGGGGDGGGSSGGGEPHSSLESGSVMRPLCSWVLRPVPRSPISKRQNGAPPTPAAPPSAWAVDRPFPLRPPRPSHRSRHRAGPPGLALPDRTLWRSTSWAWP